MPTIYYNQGSAGGYAGIDFTEGQTLLNDIHDQLVLSGWTSILDDGDSGLIRLSGIDGVDNCYMQATTKVNIVGFDYDADILTNETPTVHYKFTDTGLTLADFSGNNYDATATSATGTSATGLVNTSEGYWTFSDSQIAYSDIRVPTKSSAYTFELLFTCNTNGGLNGFRGAQDTSGAGGWHFELSVNSNGKLRYYYFDGSANIFDSIRTVNDGNPHHVVLIHRSDGLIEYWIDGIFDNISTNPVFSNTFGGAAFIALGHNRQYNGLLNGDIDEFSYYEYEISRLNIPKRATNSVNPANNGDTLRLNIQGSLDDTFTNLSPSMETNLLTTSGIGPEWELDYTLGSTNSFWFTADPGSFAIMIKDANEPSNTYSAWRFGFYDRLSTNDADAWGLGPLWTCTKGQYVARSAFDGSEWHAIENDFDSDAGRTTTGAGITSRDYYNTSSHPMGYFNPFTQCLTGLDTYSSSIVPGAKRRFGAPNPYTGTIQPALHYIQEGGFDFELYPPLNASQITGLSLYFRGTVKHVACGFAHISAPGSIISSGSQVFVCPGLQGLGLRIG